MDLLYPRLGKGRWPAILLLALQGAALAGLYGMAHDQVTYAIAPEYFTRFKFEQFRGTDLGLPPRWHVAEIGFLATWWVGLFAGWLLARVAAKCIPLERMGVRVRQAFGIVLLGALLAATAGGVTGFLTLHGAALEAWSDWTLDGVHDLRRFVIVGYIHDGGYLGALAGLVGGIVFLRKCAKEKDSEKD